MAAPKNPRKPTYSDPIVKQAHDTAKRDLSRTKERLAKDRELAGKMALRPKAKQDTVAMRHAGVASGLFSRLKAVMNSYGLAVPVRAIKSDHPGAWTDFESITVNYNSELVELAEDVTSNLDALRQLAGETRGLFFHELGHIRFSIPLKTLMEMAGDSFGAQPGSKEALHQSWNILEDQRMESAVVEESPHVASYLTVLVLRLIATDDRLGPNYPLLAGRWYLPADVVQESFDRYAALHGKDEAKAVRDCIERYMSATTAHAMVAEVYEMNRLTQGNALLGFDDHGSLADSGDPSGGNPQDKLRNSATDLDSHEPPAPPAPSKPDDKADKADGSGSGKSDDKGDSKPDAPTPGSGDSGSKDKDDKPSKDPGKGWDESDGDTPSEGKVQDALDKALDDWQNDQTLTSDVASVNEATQNGDTLPYYPHTKVSESEVSNAIARRLAIEITEAFRTATADQAPLWVGQQRQGALDVIRYATRQAGDMEVFRRYQEHGDPGADLKVTVFLDVSVSMDGTGEALGGAAWAVKTAGDSLGIETDVYVFNSKAHAIYLPSDRAEYIPNILASGGTNPTDLIQAVLTEESDKAHHLVLVMTDGEWGNKGILGRYAADNRTLVLFKYGRYSKADPELRAQHEGGLVLNYGVDEGHMIDDLFDIPRILENLLVRVAGRKTR